MIGGPPFSEVVACFPIDQIVVQRLKNQIEAVLLGFQYRMASFPELLRYGQLVIDFLRV